MLPILRLGEQPIDQFFVGIWAIICKKLPDFQACGRKSGQIQGGTTDERSLIRLFRGGQSLRLESSEDEIVDGILHLVLIFDHWRGRTSKRHKRPVFFPRSSLPNPAGQVLNLLLVECFARFCQRHTLFVVVGGYSVIQFALFRFAGDNDGIPLGSRESPRLGVQTQFPLAILRIGAVAGVAVLREDGADIAVEINLSGPIII